MCSLMLWRMSLVMDSPSRYGLETVKKREAAAWADLASAKKYKGAGLAGQGRVEKSRVTVAVGRNAVGPRDLTGRTPRPVDSGCTPPPAASA